MRSEQLSLWEDEKQIILEREKVDISTLRSSDNRKNLLNTLPKETYYIYKTGGINPFKKELGPIFPFFKNDKTGKILMLVKSGVLNGSSLYPHININTHDRRRRGHGYKLYIHKIAGLAFIKLNAESIKIKTMIDHLDGDFYNYLPSNLEWVTPSENNRRRKKYYMRKG